MTKVSIPEQAQTNRHDRTVATASLTAQQLFTEAETVAPGWYNPLLGIQDNLLNAIRAVIHSKEGIWLDPRSPARFVKAVARMLAQRREQGQLRCTLFGYNATTVETTLFGEVMQDMTSQLKYAHAAFLSNDPQLAMSILFDRPCTMEELDAGDWDGEGCECLIDDIPIIDPFQLREVASPDDVLMLADSALLKDRFLYDRRSLGAIVTTVQERNRDLNSQTFHPLPRGVLLGQSNFEAREDALDAYLTNIKENCQASLRASHSYRDQVEALSAMVREWKKRAAMPEYASTLLPAPFSAGDPGFARQVHPIHMWQSLDLGVQCWKEEAKKIGEPVEAVHR